MHTHRQYRSVFWPIVLLGVGAVWLLSNLGYIQAIDLGFLARLWPILLIVIGLDILFGRIAPWVSAIFGLLVVAALIGVLIYAPALGLSQPSTVTTEHLSAPLDNAQSAVVDLDLSLEASTVKALTGSEDLLVADLRHYGTAYLRTSGETERMVSLGKLSNSFNATGLTFSFPATSWDNDLYWDVSLTDQIPLKLNIKASLGSTELDLSGLMLTALNLDDSMGSVDLVLPVSAEQYTVDVNGSAGSLEVTLPENSNLTFYLDGSAGSTHFQLPSNHALHVEVLDGGLGSVNLPSDLVRISGNGENQEGIWENQDFAGATYKITIIIQHVGPGSITIQ